MGPPPSRVGRVLGRDRGSATRSAPPGQRQCRDGTIAGPQASEWDGRPPGTSPALGAKAKVWDRFRGARICPVPRDCSKQAVVGACPDSTLTQGEGGRTAPRQGRDRGRAGPRALDDRQRWAEWKAQRPARSRRAARRTRNPRVPTATVRLPACCLSQGAEAGRSDRATPKVGGGFYLGPRNLRRTVDRGGLHRPEASKRGRRWRILGPPDQRRCPN